MTDFFISRLPPGKTGEKLKQFLKKNERSFQVATKLDEITGFVQEVEDSPTVLPSENFTPENTVIFDREKIGGTQRLSPGRSACNRTETIGMNPFRIQGISSLQPKATVVVGRSAVLSHFAVLQEEPCPLNAVDIFMESDTRGRRGSSIVFSSGNSPMHSDVKEELQEENPPISTNQPLVFRNKETKSSVKEEQPEEFISFFSLNPPRPQQQPYSQFSLGIPDVALIKEDAEEARVVERFVKEEEMDGDCHDTEHRQEESEVNALEENFQETPTDLHLFAVSVKDRLHQCKLCCNYFPTATILDHWGSHPRCPCCRKRFRSQELLSTHMHMHAVCNICGKSFSSMSGLKHHIKRHMNGRRFECAWCKKCFRDKWTWKTHTRIHTEDKPFECVECQMRFPVRSSLKNHMYTHTGEKPFECEICQKHFSQKCNLMTHLRTHTGEKPYECQECEHKFTRSSALEAHRRRFHDIKKTSE